jgi:hypothetical protein
VFDINGTDAIRQLDSAVINAASGSGFNTAHIVPIGSGDFVYFDRLHGLCSQNTLGHRFHKVMSPFADRTGSYIARTTGDCLVYRC